MTISLQKTARQRSCGENTTSVFCTASQTDWPKMAAQWRELAFQSGDRGAAHVQIRLLEPVARSLLARRGVVSPLYIRMHGGKNTTCFLNESVLQNANIPPTHKTDIEYQRLAKSNPCEQPGISMKKFFRGESWVEVLLARFLTVKAFGKVYQFQSTYILMAANIHFFGVRYGLPFKKISHRSPMRHFLTLKH